MTELLLQLFAEGGEGGMGVGDASPASTSETQVDTAQEARDFNAEFEELIKGDYKDAYNKRVHNTVQQRLRSTKATVDAYNALTPTLKTLYAKYGVQEGDINALNQAIEEDDTYFEDEALERGISVEQLKEIRRMERENEALRDMMHQREMKENADRIYNGWMQEAEQLKMQFPNFDLDTELQNPEFLNLISNNTSMDAAYKVCHMDEIIGGAMTYTAQQVQGKLAKSIASNANRPSENGTKARATATSRIDVSKLTNKDLDEINRRVARGERIVL